MSDHGLTGVRGEIGAHELLTTTRAVRLRLDLEREVDPALLGRIYREEFDRFYRHSDAGLYKRVDADPRHAAQSRRTRDSAEHLAAVMSRVPVIVIPCLTPRLADGDVLAAKHRLGTVYPTVWSFMLAARLRGLGTCWTGMTLGREAEIAEIVGIDPAEVEQVCMIPLAHHTGTTFRPAWRPPAEDFIHWDRW